MPVPKPSTIQSDHAQPDPPVCSTPTCRNSTRLSILLGLIFSAVTVFARNPQPAVRIPLEPIGFQSLAARYMLAGSTMLTLQYVDDNHLLLTYATRGLIHRTPDDPPTDLDRNVRAVLLELPSGRVLAQTEWLLHDHGQYLWPLRDGHFLLRIRNTFSTFAPLPLVKPEEAFTLHPFLHSSRQIVAAVLSADSSFLTIESIKQPPIPPPAPRGIAAQPPPDTPEVTTPSNVQVNFYRLSTPVKPLDPVTPRAAGHALSHRIVELPINSSGMINVLDQGRSRWAFDFKSHGGKVNPLGLFDSTCRPSPVFVTSSEFISFGCHGGSSRQLLAGFNLRGDEMWEQTLYGSYLSPHIVFAPTVGRFALGRVLINSAAVPTDSLTSAEVNGQALDVLQMDSGRILLHIDCTPVARAGQNFALSPNGMTLAAVRDGAIEVYALPALTAKDKSAIARAQAAAPEPSEAMIDLMIVDPSSIRPTLDVQADQPPAPGTPSGSSTPPTASQSASDQPIPTNSAPAKTVATPSADPPGPPVQNGDEPAQRRAPPTLYNPPSTSSEPAPH